ncbi:nucleotidyltransferase family protein [Dyella sp. 2HG41-7]|uniref:nucleotidyltransferase family protein n=1 Tax=Dyella sp. 2HG41-7 TaxID=2883239 RepID=UPI001F293C41|nr:nucleotidyltransferase family protein [Dyella sp. 2HG41-7]
MPSPRHASVVILLLAAGEGHRFGGAKQLADLAGEPMARRVARTLLGADMPVLVVTGAYADDVEAILDDLPLGIRRCEDWQLGMGQSLATGARELMHAFPEASAALVYLADQPMVDMPLLDRMIQRHHEAPDRILATAQHDVQGPPVLFPRDCFDALASLSGAHGARSLLQQHASRVEVFSSQNGIDVDTPEDLRRVHVALAVESRKS